MRERAHDKRLRARLIELRELDRQTRDESDNYGPDEWER